MVLLVTTMSNLIRLGLGLGFQWGMLWDILYRQFIWLTKENEDFETFETSAQDCIMTAICKNHKLLDDFKTRNGIQYDTAPPPPTRTSSPMSGQPLRRKDLIPITLMQDADNNKVTCAASGNTISTQKSFSLLVRGGGCLTSRTFEAKHVLQLQKASSGFAASGETVKCQIKVKWIKIISDVVKLLLWKARQDWGLLQRVLLLILLPILHVICFVSLKENPFLISSYLWRGPGTKMTSFEEKFRTRFMFK